MFKSKTKIFKSKPVVEEAIETILEMISIGQIKSGDRFPSERELALSLHISRSSLREAMKALSYSNIIITKPGSGAYLASDYVLSHVINLEINPAMILQGSYAKQIFEARRILETQMTKLAINRITNESILEMKKALKNMKEHSADNDIDAYTHADMNFHRALAKAAQNDFLYKAILPFLEMMEQLIKHRIAIPNNYSDTLSDHYALLDAIISGDLAHANIIVGNFLDYDENNIRYI